MIEKWDWSAWHSEKGLQLCPLDARGLWFEMLGIMAQAKPKGCLVSNGKQIKLKALARLVSSNVSSVSNALSDLEKHGIFSRLEDGTIYCRRVYKKKEEKEEAIEIVHDDIDIKLTQYLINWITKNDPGSYIIKRLKNSQILQDKWVETCRKLRVDDERSPEDIKRVIQFSQRSDFWKGNILSMTKLKKQFSQLLLKSKKNKQSGVQDFIQNRQRRNDARV